MENSRMEEADCCDSGDSTATPELNAPRNRRERPWEQADLAARPESASPVVESDRVPRRWDRLVRLVGNQGIRNLMRARVTVFGLGGVGSYVAESLAR